MRHGGWKIRKREGGAGEAATRSRCRAPGILPIRARAFLLLLFTRAQNSFGLGVGPNLASEPQVSRRCGSAALRSDAVQASTTALQTLTRPSWPPIRYSALASSRVRFAPAADRRNPFFSFCW